MSELDNRFVDLITELDNQAECGLNTYPTSLNDALKRLLKHKTTKFIKGERRATPIAAVYSANVLYNGDNIDYKRQYNNKNSTYTNGNKNDYNNKNLINYNGNNKRLFYSNGNESNNNDINNIRCYKCGEYGHYSNKCTDNRYVYFDDKKGITKMDNIKKSFVKITDEKQNTYNTNNNKNNNNNNIRRNNKNNNIDPDMRYIKDAISNNATGNGKKTFYSNYISAVCNNDNNVDLPAKKVGLLVDNAGNDIDLKVGG
jgi:hypothetical protein